MNDDAAPASFRRIAAAAGAMFAVVLAFMAIQMVRGHDPALGTTPKPVPKAAPASSQAQLPQEYGEDQGYQDEYQAPQQYQVPYQVPQQSYQPPPVQSTTS